jgi:hypothetical protein
MYNISSIKESRWPQPLSYTEVVLCIILVILTRAVGLNRYINDTEVVLHVCIILVLLKRDVGRNRYLNDTELVLHVCIILVLLKRAVGLIRYLTQK